MKAERTDTALVEPSAEKSGDGAAVEIVRPWPEPPGEGEAIEVAPGLLWMRLPLPLRLNHVNVYALADRGSWTILDAGNGNEETFAAWERLLAGPLGEWPIARLIVTHFHPDHVGAAGWLLRRTGAELLMSRSEFLLALLRRAGTAPDSQVQETEFFRSHGASPELLGSIGRRVARFRAAVTQLPPQARILADGDTLEIGERVWQVATGGGHSPEQIMLHSLSDGLLLSADHLIDRISPNISLTYLEPHGDPLTTYMAVLGRLDARVTSGSLVLPGHRLPFHGAHTRIRELTSHHHLTLEKILKACAETPKQGADLIATVYERSFGADGQALALSEILAHLSYLERSGKLQKEVRSNGRIFFWT